jgi:proteasome accessory factor A
MLGQESEYSFTAWNAAGIPLSRDAVALRLFATARRKLPHIPGDGQCNLFLANGSRFYLDCGCHPELSTPECTNPWDAVRYGLAGEAILGRLANDLVAEDSDIADAIFYKCNVCYGGNRTTWGAHESYCHGSSPELFPRQMIPFLVTRILFTGAGGFDSQSPGLRFLLSPRVPHFIQEVSSDSTRSRGIFHTKDETLSRNGYHRLHIIFGENVCSHRAAWLKVGATALVVAMINAGLTPGEGVQLQSPLAALRTIAGDTTCKALIAGTDQKRLTAISVQRRYLESAKGCCSAPFMPAWAGEVCTQWEEILDRLENGAPGSVSGTLDWAIKRVVYGDFLRRHGITWDSLPHWSRVYEGLSAALRRQEPVTEPIQLTCLLGDHSPIPAEVKHFESYLRQNGLTWEGFEQFLRLRPKMLEIDWRFGQVGERGIFAAMERDGVLDHHVAGIDHIDQAMENPPTVGRARVRGQCIRRLASFNGNGAYRCSWQTIWDYERKRTLDLSDPFETEERWQDTEPAASEEAHSRHLMEELLARLRTGT